MSDGSAAGGTGETAVRDQCHRSTETHTDDGGGRIQHLTHAGAALRAFITDDHDVARNDPAALDGIDRGLFVIEYARGPFMLQHGRIHSRTLDDTAIRGNVAL